MAHIFHSTHTTFHSIYGQCNEECTNRTSHPFITLILCRLTVLWLISLYPIDVYVSHCAMCLYVCVCVCVMCACEPSNSLSQICLPLNRFILTNERLMCLEYITFLPFLLVTIMASVHCIGVPRRATRNWSKCCCIAVLE